MLTTLRLSFLNIHPRGGQWLLGIAQLVAHLSLFYMIALWSLEAFLISFLVYFLMTSIGVSIVTHRCLAHKSIVVPRWFEILGSFFFTISLQGSTVAWVAMHREHHAHSDREGDPHCPRGHVLRTHFLSMFYSPKIKFAARIARDPLHYATHRYYWPINLCWSALLFVSFGIPGVIVGHLFPAFLCWQAIGLSKTLAHLGGYRNFDTKDSSYNLPVLGYLNFGEGWHNNHHARPTDWTFQSKAYEVDISALIIALGMRFFGFKESGVVKPRS